MFLEKSQNLFRTYYNKHYFIQGKFMQYIQSSSKSVQEVVQAIQAIAPNHKFGVLSVRDMKATLASKGFDFKEECQILDVCNPSVAFTFLSEDMSLASVLPCKISVYTQENETIVSMSSLPQLVDDINPDFLELAQETQETLLQIIDEAV